MKKKFSPPHTGAIPKRYCKYCGKAIKEGQRRCPHCSRIISPKPQQLSFSQKCQRSGILVKNAISQHSILFSCVLAVVFIMIVVICLMVSLLAYQTIDAKELCRISFTGVNGEAKVSAILDVPDEEKNISGCDWLSTDEETAQTKFIGNPKPQKLSRFQHAISKEDFDGKYKISFSLSKTVGISNGDIITVTCAYDKDYLKAHGIKLKDTTFDFAVENLPDAQQIDLFDGIILDFIGSNGYGEAYVNTDNAIDFLKSDVTYTFTNDSTSLSNGNIVMVTASYSGDNMDFYSGSAAFDGKVYSFENNVTKKFRVKGLSLDVQDIDLFNYAKFSFSGADGYGQFNADTSNAPEFVDLYFIYTIDKENGKLKNGDVVTVTASYNGSAGALNSKKQLVYNNQKYSFKDSQTKEITVSGLKKTMTFDPFKDISLVLQKDYKKEGVQYYKANVDKGNLPENIAGMLSYSLSDTEGIREGDRVTVKVSVANGYTTEDIAGQGYILPKKMVASFTIKNPDD